MDAEQFFVTYGSVYNPGWQVVEQLSDTHQRVRANFGDESWSQPAADEFLAELLTHEETQQ